MNDDLRNLIQLQEIDREIVNYKHDIERIEQELKETQSELVDDQQVLEEKHKELMLYKQQRMDLNLDWETAKLELEKLKKMSLQVKTNKEYQDILRDIDHKKNEIDEIVEDILLQDEKIEKLEEDFKELEEELAANKRKIEGLEEHLRSQIKENNEKIKEMDLDKDEIRKKISERVLRQYNRIQTGSKSGGIALVSIQKDGTCCGCHGSLPIQKVVSLKESGTYDICEMCGRLIYFLNESEKDEL